MNKKLYIIVYVFILVICIFLIILLDFYSWLIDHEIVFAAIIQVVGLVFIGLIVNKWIEDYHERKTARNEKYKLQNELLQRFLRSYGKAYGSNRLLAFRLEKRMSENYEKNNGDEFYTEMEALVYNSVEYISDLNIVMRMSTYAFRNSTIAKNIVEMSNLLTEQWSLFRKPDKFQEKNKSIRSRLNELQIETEYLIGKEISEWLI